MGPTSVRCETRIRFITDWQVLSVVSRFMHNPSVRHMNAVVRILRHLKSILGNGLMFLKQECGVYILKLGSKGGWGD